MIFKHSYLQPWRMSGILQNHWRGAIKISRAHSLQFINYELDFLACKQAKTFIFLCLYHSFLHSLNILVKHCLTITCLSVLLIALSSPCVAQLTFLIFHQMKHSVSTELATQGHLLQWQLILCRTFHASQTQINMWIVCMCVYIYMGKLHMTIMHYILGWNTGNAVGNWGITQK